MCAWCVTPHTWSLLLCFYYPYSPYCYYLCCHWWIAAYSYGILRLFMISICIPLVGIAGTFVSHSCHLPSTTPSVPHCHPRRPAHNCPTYQPCPSLLIILPSPHPSSPRTPPTMPYYPDPIHYLSSKPRMMTYLELCNWQLKTWLIRLPIIMNSKTESPKSAYGPTIIFWPSAAIAEWITQPQAPTEIPIKMFRK